MDKQAVAAALEEIALLLAQRAQGVDYAAQVAGPVVYDNYS